MLHHVDLARRWSAGFDRTSFAGDLRTVYAVTRCLVTASARRPEGKASFHRMATHGRRR
jgi:hypothetical protein